jgi:hypothetical protein
MTLVDWVLRSWKDAIYKHEEIIFPRCTTVQRLTSARNFVSAVNHAGTDHQVGLLVSRVVVTGSCKWAELFPVPQPYPPWFPSRSKLHLHT